VVNKVTESLGASVPTGLEPVTDDPVLTRNLPNARYS